MSTFVYLLVVFILIYNNVVVFIAYSSSDVDTNEYTRSDFPSDFVFGAGTSAYQVEGAVLEDGRTYSIWDTFAHSDFYNGANADVACDGYHKYKEDIQLIADTGLEAFRFSISWSRLIPSEIKGHYLNATAGTCEDMMKRAVFARELGVPIVMHDYLTGGFTANTTLAHYCRDNGLLLHIHRAMHAVIDRQKNHDGRGSVNAKGLQFYNNFIDELISHGIQPHVTLHHIDLPQILEDEYGGWISRKAVKDFVAYADVCFREFGDRVLHWTTFNEANIFTLGGYDFGLTPPVRCSSPFGIVNCTRGNSTYEPYLAAHHLLLAHASTVRLYRKNYKAVQHGFVGINIYFYWFEPYTNTTEDVEATKRAIDFYVGWFLNPLVNGDYPEIVKKNAGNRLPSFTKLESERIKDSFDFVGINHYSTLHVEDNPSSLEMDVRDVSADMAAKVIFNGSLTPTQLPVAPMGLKKLLVYLKEEYGNPSIYIHENGQVQPRNGTLMDTPRVEYLHAYIGALLDVIRNGSNTIGYFVWSFFDLFELLDGYNTGYGLYYVDLDDKELTRYPKLSAHWYASFLKGRNMSGIFPNVDAKDSFYSSH